MKKILFLSLFLMVCTILSAQKRVKVACVGNSITYGYTLPNPATDSYPSQLQQLLGETYEVGNFGKSGATLLNKGHRPYMQQEEFKKAMEGTLEVVQVDIDQESALADFYTIEMYPTFILMRKGEQLWRQSGELPLERLEKAVKEYELKA